MFTSLSTFIAYIACGMFFQANEKRTTLSRFQTSDGRFEVLHLRAARVLAWSLLGLSLYLVSLPQGFERGFTIWIGILGAVGFLNLFVAAIKPSVQLPSMALAAILLAMTLLGSLLL